MSDLIEREDAIKAVNRAKAEGMTECPTYYLGTIPSADLNSEFSEWARHWFKDSADRPQGEWEERPSEDWISIRRWYCSECGEWQTYGMTNYCPNCGADMRGDNDGKDIQSADE